MNQEAPQRKNVAWLVAGTSAILIANSIEDAAVYLEHTWPAIGLGGALAISLMLSAHYRDTTWSDRLAKFNWILFAAYLLHGFEVDGVDLLGREYAFLAYANETRGLELTARDILRMNTISIWLIMLCAVWGGERFRWTGLAAAGVVLANGFLHIGNAIAAGEYNPGLGTSLVLFLPLSVLYFRHARNTIGVSRREIAGGVLFGLGGHVLLPILMSLHMPITILVPFAFLPLAANIAAIRGSRLRNG
jgi:hypothetical protein